VSADGFIAGGDGYGPGCVGEKGAIFVATGDALGGGEAGVFWGEGRIAD
jgi:hypothetical protein